MILGSLVKWFGRRGRLINRGLSMIDVKVLPLTFSAVMFASATPAAAQEECLLDKMTAEMFATHRQMGGRSVTEMMATLGKEPWLREMLLDAYSQPLMLTPETRSIAVDEFANKWAVRCYKGGSVFPPKQ